MGKHVHEHVELEVDQEAVAADNNDSPEEQLMELLNALGDKDVDVTVKTETLVNEDE